MTTTDPTSAMHEALAAHLRAQLRAVSGLGDSDVLTYFPAGTQDLELGDTRVVCAVERAGEPRTTRLGGPRAHRVIPGVLPAGTIRYDYDVVEQDFTVALYAPTQAMRDEGSELVFRALNMPFWSTVPPIVSTAIASAQRKGAAASSSVPAPGRYFVTISDAAQLLDVWEGTMLAVDDATPAAREVISVDKVTPFGFWATFAKAHGAAATLLEVAARHRNAELGLSLRCPLHYNGVARFVFGEPKTIDDAEAGRAAGRQEWRSLRDGVGKLRHLREIAGVVQDGLAIAGTGAGGASTVIF